MCRPRLSRRLEVIDNQTEENIMSNLTTFPLEALAWQRAAEVDRAARAYRAVGRRRRRRIRIPKLPRLLKPRWGRHTPTRIARA